jgi:DNA-binding phage protein
MLGTYGRFFDDDDVVKLLNARVKSAGGQTAFARRTGVNRTNLNQALHSKKPITPTILAALNLRVVYAPVGASKTRR